MDSLTNVKQKGLGTLMDSKLLMDIMSIIIIILFSFGIVYVICGDYLKKGIISLVIGVC